MGTEPLTSFEDLEIYRMSYQASLKLHALSKTFPKEELFGLITQLRKASKSIPVNIAEGFAKRRLSSAEFKRFLMISFGSCEEVRVWLRYARDLKYISAHDFDELDAEYVRIGKMIYSLHRNWK